MQCGLSFFLPEELRHLPPDHLNHQVVGWNRSMRPYSKAIKADVRQRMGPPHRVPLLRGLQRLLSPLWQEHLVAHRQPLKLALIHQQLGAVEHPGWQNRLLA